MEEKVGLVFSWDAKTKAWIRERGPEDAAPPPAAPRDIGAVQTYFLDPANGRWQPTILGLRARQIAADLGSAYRSPYVAGLAMTEMQQRDPRLMVEAHDAKEHTSRMPLVAGGAALLLLIAGGAFAAQLVLAPTKDAEAASPPRTVTPAPTPAVTPSAAGTESAAGATSAAPAATAPAATQPPVIRTPAPTAPPAPATITLRARTPSGVTITYTGPSSVRQNEYIGATFTVILPNGLPSLEVVNVRLGTGTAVNAKTDGSGTYRAEIPANTARGDQVLNVYYSDAGTLVVLGTLTVR